ncbi:RteC domain-containing protein [Pedobacter endophyticus]|uniref:RteC domain-containing protein n=1 Tax=Pedobacter endophyticus TaxID=2789740 RepID=A0A7S9PZI3_9SPHI|nr:RteC domain-containing protein [Pedobacter endophyticus]QPH40548.1 RteC domain-containing protein [Pedobacter endophyticus]
MDTEFFDHLYATLEDELIALGNDAAFYPARLAVISKGLKELRERAITDGFITDRDEVMFFKFVKPRFYMLYIYEVERFNLISAIPRGTDDLVKDYYLAELAFIKRVYSQHRFLYDYYQREEEAMDDAFFLRQNLDVLSPDVAGAGIIAVFDDGFSTNQDYNFARFRALEKLEDYIIERIGLIYIRPEMSLPPDVLLLRRKLQWTDEKIKLVELAYGIFLSGAVNNGKLEIADVVHWLEQSLNVDLGVAYRKFISIGRRKNVSYTKYLDEMSAKIVAYISEKNSYVPASFRFKDKHSSNAH